MTKTDALLTVTKAVATVVANAKSRFYGAANPALDAVVTGQVAGGDAVAYTLATTAVQLSPRRHLPDRGHARNQSELRRDQDRCAADGDQGRGDGDGQREEQVLRRGEPGARRGGDGPGGGR